MKFVILLLIPLSLSAQLSKKDSLWLPFKPLIGQWTGTGEGVDGKGIYTRTISQVLNRNFIEIKNKTEYPVSEKAPKGYIHEDHGIISYDKQRKKFIFRQFHSEGYVNQYVLDAITENGTTFTFVSEAIENIPSGWRAKEVWKLGTNTFQEQFDLAEPGKDFEKYTIASFAKLGE